MNLGFIQDVRTLLPGELEPSGTLRVALRAKPLHPIHERAIGARQPTLYPSEPAQLWSGPPTRHETINLLHCSP